MINPVPFEVPSSTEAVVTFQNEEWTMGERGPVHNVRGTRSPRFLVSLLLIFGLVGSVSPLFAQSTPPTSKLGGTRPILVDLSFSGNTSIADVDIRSRIATAESSLSNLAKLASIARRGGATELGRHLRRIAGSGVNVRYLNTSVVEEDKEAIRQLYKEFGFHDARVRAMYTFDTSRSLATLQFEITEGEQYTVWGVEILGISKLPEEIRDRVSDLSFLNSGRPFRVVDVDLEVDRILATLKSSGFPFASELRKPAVLVCAPPRCPVGRDSVLIYIDPGTRYRITEIIVTPSTRDTLKHPIPVRKSVIMAQLQFNLGDWYDQQNVDRTRQNLYRLGIFDEVRIDPVDEKSESQEMGLRIRYTLRDQNEVEGSLELSVLPRSEETVVTTGISGGYTRLNLFRQAVNASLSGRIQGRVPDFQEIEYSLNGRSDIPLTGFLMARFLSLSGSASLGTADRAGSAELTSQRFSGALDLTWTFPDFVGLTGGSFRLSYQKNAYRGVADFIAERARIELENANLSGECDTTGLTSEIVDVLARNVYRLQVLQGDAPELRPSDESRDLSSELQQTLIIGGTLVSDKRNDFFSPSKGLFAEGKLDFGITGGASPIGSFVRLEGDFRYFMSGLDDDVVAFRAHGGFIFQPKGFPLTPLNNRFHAGGANSIRGWGAREMLVTSPAEVIADTCASPVISGIIADSRRLLGGLWLLELSTEYRWNVSADWVIIPFIDAGNAYFRNYSDDLPLITFNTIVSNIAVAAGINIGYITPAGPVRFGAGFPIINPIDDNSYAIQVSIGHAF